MYPINYETHIKSHINKHVLILAEGLKPDHFSYIV